MRRFPLGLLTVAALAACGCSSKPKAPALLDGPVYQNTQEGFRFLVPEGWTMSAKAEIPPGSVEKERLLVQYRRQEGDHPATLEVSRVDLPDSTDWEEYLSGPSYSVSHWKSAEPAESVQAGGANGSRFRFTSGGKNPRLAKEVTVFRRGTRVYFFTLVFAPKDTTAVEQVRRVIGRLVWS